MAHLSQSIMLVPTRAGCFLHLVSRPGPQVSQLLSYLFKWNSSANSFLRKGVWEVKLCRPCMSGNVLTLPSQIIDSLTGYRFQIRNHFPFPYIFIPDKLLALHLALFLERSPVLSFGACFFVSPFWLPLCVDFFMCEVGLL